MSGQAEERVFMSPRLDGLAYAFLIFAGLIMFFGGVIPEKHHSGMLIYLAYAAALVCGYLTYRITMKSIAISFVRSAISLLWLINFGIVLMRVFP